MTTPIVRTISIHEAVVMADWEHQSCVPLGKLSVRKVWNHCTIIWQFNQQSRDALLCQGFPHQPCPQCNAFQRLESQHSLAKSIIFLSLKWIFPHQLQTKKYLSLFISNFFSIDRKSKSLSFAWAASHNEREAMQKATTVKRSDELWSTGGENEWHTASSHTYSS